MKTIFRYILPSVAALACMTSCGDFEPTGYEQVREVPAVKDLKAEISRHDINLSWSLPAQTGITDVRLIINGNNDNTLSLGSSATGYAVKGQPMGEEYYYTVKVVYDGRYVSDGVTTTSVLPVETLSGVNDLTASVNGRTVTLSWTLPQAEGVTGARVYRDGDVASAVSLPAGTTTFEYKSQPMDRELVYTVEAMYDTYYPSVGKQVTATVPFIPAKAAFLLTADNWRDLADDDERAAARWFASQDNTEFVTAGQLEDLDTDLYPVLWVEIDRVGLAQGWTNLPAEFTSPEVIDALRSYSAKGGNLFLANMATQLTVPLGFVPDNMAPTVFGSGEGGTGNDVWVINPHLGIDFMNGGDQGYYDRASHEIFSGLVLEDPNNYGYTTLPLIGPGQREDHNCLWDCNIYGRGAYKDVIANFEATTGSLVLATWGHVRDHCVAGLVDFYATAEHGRCVAMGLAAYEWNQNSGLNPYQENIEKLTENILNYLK